MSGRFNTIDERVTLAKKVKADAVLSKFANFMRAKMLRVSDLIGRVDTSCDGVIDEVELTSAIKMVKIKMSGEDIHTLFQFLDSTGDGTIDANELETAMRDHRRNQYERQSLMDYIEKTKLVSEVLQSRGIHVRGGVGNNVGLIDCRMLQTKSSNKKQISSIPQLGQHLIHTQYESEGGDVANVFASFMSSQSTYGGAGAGGGTQGGTGLGGGNSMTSSFMSEGGGGMSTPMFGGGGGSVISELKGSGVKQQADVAILKGKIADRTLEQQYASGVNNRRTTQRSVVARRQVQRELLESRSGQREENNYQRACDFYEGTFGQVDLVVKEARNIEMADANGSDGICKVMFAENEARWTSVSWNSLNPVWNETFSFVLKDPEERKECVKVELYDQDPAAQEFLGQTHVRIEDLEPERLVDIAVELQKASTGSIFLSVCLIPLEVLIQRKTAEFANEREKMGAKSKEAKKIIQI